MKPEAIRAIKEWYRPLQPFDIKGDFEHAVWTDPVWKERVVLDHEGNALRGKDLEEYYWRLRGE